MDAEAKEISERLALVERSMRRYRAALTAVTSDRSSRACRETVAGRRRKGAGASSGEEL